MSAGKISLLASPSIGVFLGSIISYTGSDISVNYTYVTSDLNDHNKYNYTYRIPVESNVTSYDSTSFELNEAVSVESYTCTSLIGALNAYSDYYTLHNYSHWLLNKEKNAVSFTINGNSPFTLNSQVILLPSLASEGNMWFDGWYEDEEFTTQLTEFEVAKDTSLYGRTCGPNFTVTLDANGGDELAVKEVTIGCDRVYGDLPIPTRTRYIFIGWFTEKTGGDKVESGDKVAILSNHILYAHWTIEIGSGSRQESDSRQESGSKQESDSSDRSFSFPKAPFFHSFLFL